MTQNISQDMNYILVAVGAWKLENGKIHGQVKPTPSLFDFKPVIFDDRVAEDLVAGLVDLLARTILIAGG